MQSGQPQDRRGNLTEEYSPLCAEREQGRRRADKQDDRQPGSANPPGLVKVEVMTVAAAATLDLRFGQRLGLHPDQKGFSVASSAATRLVATRFSSEKHGLAPLDDPLSYSIFTMYRLGCGYEIFRFRPTK